MSPQLFNMKYATSLYPKLNHSDLLHCKKFSSFLCSQLETTKFQIILFFTFFPPNSEFMVFSQLWQCVSFWCLQSIVLILPNEESFVHSAQLVAGSGLTSPKLPGWCLSCAMIHQSNRATGTWARPVWAAGTARFFSSLEDKERGT